MAAEAVLHQMLDLAEGLLHEVQRIFLPRDVPTPPTLTGAPLECGRPPERASHGARPARAATRFPDGRGEDLRDPRSPGYRGQSKQALVTLVHYRGDVVTLGQDEADDLLGSGRGRGTPEALSTAVATPGRRSPSRRQRPLHGAPAG